MILSMCNKETTEEELEVNLKWNDDWYILIDIECSVSENNNSVS